MTSPLPPVPGPATVASDAGALRRLRGRAREWTARPRARHLLVSFAGTAVVTLGGILTGTLLARGLGPEGRGAFAAMVLWPTIAVAIGDLGVSVAFGFFSARGRDAVPRLNRLAYRAALWQSAYLVPLTVAVSWLALSEADVMPLAAGLLLAVVFVPSSLVTRNLDGVLNGQLMVSRFYLLRASSLIIAGAALGLLLALSALTLWTAVVSWMLGLVGMVVVGAVLAHRAARERPVPREGAPADPVQPRQLVRYGLKALAGSLYPVELLSIDQVLLVFLLGKRDLGLYVSALALTNVPRLVSYAIGMVSMPVVAARSGAGQSATTLRYLVLAASLLLPLTLALVALTPALVTLFFGDAFHDAIGPARFLLLGSCAFGVRKVLGDCLRGAGRPGVVSIAEAGSWPLTVIAVALGSALSGLVGVAAGLAIVQTVALSALLVAWRWRAHLPRTRNELGGSNR